MPSITYISPIGLLQINSSENAISRIHFTEHEVNTTDFCPKLKKLIIEQFDEYFAGRLFQFDLPIQPSGTEFQLRVWKQLEAIEYGRQITYGELADLLCDKNLVRAVGGANAKNPLSIVVPCHRVIGRHNKLVGYAGGVWRKKWLLRHEMENANYKETLF